MARYMIQTSHDETHSDCKRFEQSLLQAGAHFLANADWGCRDGNHTAWLIIEAVDDNDARLVVPPVMRQSAVITRLSRFDADELFGFNRNASAACAA
jgi:hypothetical protein